MEDTIKCKTTSNVRRPQSEENIKWKTTANGRRQQMEDDLKWKITSYIKMKIKTSQKSLFVLLFICSNGNIR